VIIKKVRFLPAMASSSCCRNWKQLPIQTQCLTSYCTSPTADTAHPISSPLGIMFQD